MTQASESVGTGGTADLDGGSRGRKSLLLAGLLVALIAVVGMSFRVVAIRGSLPYPQHEDEHHLTERALHMLETGDFEPHFFRYPTPPIYATAACMALGYLQATARSEVMDVDTIGNVHAPYYDNARVVFPARVFFALLSILSIILIGVTGYRFTGSALVLVLAPVLVLLSSTYFNHSWQYLNVDIFGCFFVMLTLMHLICLRADSGVGERCLVAGLHCGLAIGSKYSLFLVLVPCVLHLALYRRGKWISRIVLLLATTVVVFLVTTPCLLDFTTFINDIGTEVRHYKSGHGEFTGEAGLPMLLDYIRDFAGNLGWLVVVLAVVGSVRCLFIDWKRGLVLISFPALFLIYMSMQKVYFFRNVISVFPFVALFAAIGLVYVCAALTAAIRAKRPARPAWLPAVASVVVFLVVAVTLPWARISRAHDLSPESRNRATAWLLENAPAGSEILVPEELGMDVRPLSDFKVRNYRLDETSGYAFRLLYAKDRISYYVLPVSDSAAYHELKMKLDHLVIYGANKLVTDANKICVPGGDPMISVGTPK